MKLSRLFSIALLTAITFYNSGCKEDEPIPLGSEVNGKLLAGEPGQSLSWKLTSITVQDSGGSGTVGLAACELDNIYKFTNNANQDYEATEGTTKCDSSDPATVERGNWAFTSDGKIMVVISDEVLTTFGFPLFFQLPFPGKVMQLNDSILEIELNFNDGSDNTKFTLLFIKQ